MPIPADHNWDSSAAAYARFTTVSSIYSSSAAALVRLAEIKPLQSIVDLACGTGLVTSHLLSMPFASSLRILAVDLSPRMLSYARQRVSAANVTFYCESGEKLDTVTNGKVDRIICNAALWYFDLDVLFAAVHRVLADGGRLLFSVPIDILRLRSAAVWQSDNPVICLLIERLRDHGITFRTRKASTGDIDMVGSVHAAGFAIQQFQSVETSITAAQYLAFLEIPIMADRLFLQAVHNDVLRQVIADVRKEILASPILAPPVKWQLIALERRL